MGAFDPNMKNPAVHEWSLTIQRELPKHFVAQIERRRRLVMKVETIAGTELMDVLEKLVELMYDKVQPYGDRA